MIGLPSYSEATNFNRDISARHPFEQVNQI